MRQLLWLAEGAQRERWGRASAAMALLANCNRDPRKGRSYKPADFDPFTERRASDQVLNREELNGWLKRAGLKPQEKPK